MLFPVKLAGWCALVTVAATLVLSRPCAAEESPGKHAAREAAEEAIAEESGGGPNPLAVDPDLAIWTGVVFVLLFLVLRTFAWPQITAALTEREKRIADNIAAAERQNAEARRLLQEHEAKLAAAAGEVRAMLDEARRDADHTRQRIEAEGHQAAKDEMARSVREIERARDAAVQHLAEVSANVAIDLARGVVRKEISAERQAEIVRDAVSKLKAAAPSNN
jgi:F-type H+-transporting ATPase subunit b